MKYVKILFATALIFTICSAFSMKNESSEPIYAFGVSASFTDSIIYFTSIQVLDSAQVTKEGFLAHRDLYGYQLKNYLEDNKMQNNSTCMIYYSTTRKKLEKEETRLLNKYKKNNTAKIVRIEPDKFKFVKTE